MNFECHITCYEKDSLIAERVARECRWKTSQIARDPLLGNDTFFYLTKHSANYVDIYADMKATVGVLSQDGVDVLREKIELIMYDTKTGAGGAR